MAEVRFWGSVDFDGPRGCWLWAGCTNFFGYGYLSVETRRVMVAHRFAFTLVNGPIPAGLCVCHRCDVPRCVNPAHLFLGTYADNNRDCAAKGRHGMAVFDPPFVRRVRGLVRVGFSQRTVARFLGIGQSTVSEMVNGVAWAHVPPAPVDLLVSDVEALAPTLDRRRIPEAKFSETIRGTEQRTSVDPQGFTERLRPNSGAGSPWVRSKMPAIPRKLTPKDVIQLRALGKLAAAGLTSQRAIAAHFGLSQATVSNIISGKLWPVTPAVEWQPSLRLCQIQLLEQQVQDDGGRFAGPGGVVTLPSAKAPASFDADDDSVGDVVPFAADARGSK